MPDLTIPQRLGLWMFKRACTLNPYIVLAQQATIQEQAQRIAAAMMEAHEQHQQAEAWLQHAATQAQRQ